MIALPPFLYAFGTACLHAIWQIALVYLIFKIICRFASAQGRTRYRLAYAAMLLAFSLWTYTFQSALVFPQITAYFSSEPTAAIQIAPLVAGPVMAAPEQQGGPFFSLLLLKKYVPWLGLLWAIGVLFSLVKMAGAWYWTRKIYTSPFNKLLPESTRIAACFAKKSGIRQMIQVLESPWVREPLTIGFWKPVILMPIGLQIQLNPAQLEAILLHELAHIRRFDYLANMLQLFLEAIFFFHPLFKKISKEARLHREYACDDIVLQYQTDPLMYARTLVDLHLSISQPKNSLAMTATANAPFSARIMRIAGVKNAPSVQNHWISLSLLLLLLLSASLLAFKQPRPDKPQPSAKALLSPVQTDTLPPAHPKPAPVRETAIKIDPVIGFELPRLNVFYIGIDNPVNIVASGHSHIRPELIGSGSIEHLIGSQYRVVVGLEGEVEIRIFDAVSGANLGSKYFRVMQIPDPIGQTTKKFPLTSESQHPSDNAPNVAVQLDKMNILYIGIENPVHIAVNNLKRDEWTANLRGPGSIYETPDGFTVNVTKPGTVCIDILQKTAQGEKLVSSQEYRVHRIPDATPVFQGRTTCKITHEEFLSRPMVVAAFLPNFPLDLSVKIVSYQVTLLPERGDPISFPDASTQAELPKEVQDAIQQIGDKNLDIFIDNIKILAPGDTSPRDVGGLRFRVLN